MFDEDFSVFFDVAGGFALSATWGALTVSVLFDEPTDDVLGGSAITGDPSIMVPAVAWPGIKRGDSVDIDGKGTFHVREVRQIDDGALQRLTLSTEP